MEHQSKLAPDDPYYINDDTPSHECHDSIRFFDDHSRQSSYFSGILKNSLNEIYIFDEKTLRFIQANRGAQINSGYTIKELQAFTPLDLIPSSLREDFVKFTDLLRIGEKESIRCETVLQRKDGSTYSVDIHLQLFTAGACRAFGAIALDLTHRAPKEQAVHQSAERLQRIMDLVPALISYVDTNQRYRFINKAYEQWFGRPRGDIEEYSVKDLLGPSAYSMRKHLIEAALSGQPISYDAEVPDRQGGTRYISASYIPDFDAQDRVRGVVVSVKDITEQKRAESALRASETQLRRAERLAHLGSWEMDLKTYRELWSDESYRLLGYEPQGCEPSYESFLNVVHPQDRARVTNAFAAALRGEAPYDLDFRVIHANDEERILHARGEIYQDKQGKPLRLLGTAQDITERKRSEEALRKSETKLREQAQQLSEADRRKNEFLAMLGHELRAPLAPIRNAINWCQWRSDDRDPRAYSAREIIARQVEHLAHLVGDLLDVSRISQGKVALSKERVTLEEIVARAVETAEPIISARRQELTLSMPSERLWLSADRIRMVQIVGNLLDNASKYSKVKGRIWVAAHRQGNEAIVRVRDQGIGISPDLLPYVFDIYHQAPGSLDRSGAGLGLGLTLVRKLVEMHGGTVHAFSPGLGQGSEFVVHLPLLLDSPETLVTTEGVEVGEGKGGARTILVVDDEPDSADSLAMLLEAMGHDVHMAPDGTTALAKARVVQPQVVILDIGLPGMNGYEVARYLRQESVETHMLIIALSGYGQKTDHEDPGDVAIDFHLTKPVNDQQLEALLAG
jgi:PAS domain S-box-containing protein